jgi:hypothetical protein
MAAKAATMNSGRLAPNKSYVPFPTGMTNTVDSKVCTQHGGFAAGVGCNAGIPNGMLALVWDCPNCAADGYRLYRVDGGKRDLVATPANGGSFTAALLDAPAGGFGGRCYAAVAYRGANESNLSNSYCTTGGSVVATNIFKPDHVRTARVATYNKDMFRTSDAHLAVGATHMSDKEATLGDTSKNEIARGGLHFDVGSLAQKHIMSAKLHVTVDVSYLDSGGIDHGTSCASLIAHGTDYWWTRTDWILVAGQQSAADRAFDTPSRLQPGSASGPDATYDITPIVADWAQGKEQNFGIILMTDDKGIGGSVRMPATRITRTTSRSK